MQKNVLLLVCTLILLTGCEVGPNSAPGTTAFNSADIALKAAKYKLAFTHSITLEMTEQNIAARFEKTRDACLKDDSYQCVLISAEFNSSNSAYARRWAELRVRLPHNTVKAFEDNMMRTLPGEATGTLQIAQRTMTAEDVAKPFADVELRLNELMAYRERLQALSKRNDAKIDEMIKIEEQLAATQTQIEQFSAQKTDLTNKVATELFVIKMLPDSEQNDNFKKVQDTWKRAKNILGNSAANALQTLIALVPWLPLIAIALFGTRAVLRILRRKKT